MYVHAHLLKLLTTRLRNNLFNYQHISNVYCAIKILRGYDLNFHTLKLYNGSDNQNLLVCNITVNCKFYYIVIAQLRDI